MPPSRWYRACALALIPLTLIGLALGGIPLLPISSSSLYETLHYSSILTHTPAEHSTAPSDATSHSQPAFHVLVANAKRSPALCRSLLSATILDYPAPVLINYDDDRPQDDDYSNDSASGFEDPNHSDLAAVDRFLQSSDSGIAPQDIVLVVDGRSTFFHLPASVMLRRFQSVGLSSEAWASAQYGKSTPLSSASGPRFEQRVLLGASEYCPLNSAHDLCTSLPGAPAQDSDTEIDSNGLRYPDGGAMIGRARDVSRVYSAAVKSSHRSDQPRTLERTKDIMTRLFAEQEVTRKSFLANLKAFMKHSTAADYGMALDYSSSLFMSATGLGSAKSTDVDMRRLSLDDFVALGGKPERYHLPADLKTAPQPFDAPPPPPADQPHESHGKIATFNDTLDALPDDVGWGSLPLATNPTTNTVPAALHLAPQASTRAADALWAALWYHDHARAMLRATLRRLKSPSALSAPPATSALRTNPRGGLAGVWTAEGAWLSFADACGGFGAALFADAAAESGLEA